MFLNEKLTTEKLISSNELLKDIDNIEFMQGYYFYKPLEVDEFISLVKTFNLKIPLN